MRKQHIPTPTGQVLCGTSTWTELMQSQRECCMRCRRDMASVLYVVDKLSRLRAARKLYELDPRVRRIVDKLVVWLHAASTQ